VPWHSQPRSACTVAAAMCSMMLPCACSASGSRVRHVNWRHAANSSRSAEIGSGIEIVCCALSLWYVCALDLDLRRVSFAECLKQVRYACGTLLNVAQQSVLLLLLLLLLQLLLPAAGCCLQLPLPLLLQPSIHRVQLLHNC
jgi:hypothetical protein